jgi:hypothetical protein
MKILALISALIAFSTIAQAASQPWVKIIGGRQENGITVLKEGERFELQFSPGFAKRFEGETDINVSATSFPVVMPLSKIPLYQAVSRFMHCGGMNGANDQKDPSIYFSGVPLYTNTHLNSVGGQGPGYDALFGGYTSFPINRHGIGKVHMNAIYGFKGESQDIYLNFSDLNGPRISFYLRPGHEEDAIPDMNLATVRPLKNGDPKKEQISCVKPVLSVHIRVQKESL